MFDQMLQSPVFTWLPMPHLPKVPNTFVHRARHLAAEIDLEAHEDVWQQHQTNRQEYTQRRLQIDQSDVASRYQISLPMGEDWLAWVTQNLVSDVLETSARLSVGDSHVHGAHCDLGRKWKFYYLIDRGGDAASTVFYQQKAHAIVRNEINDDDSQSIVCNDYADLIEIDRVRWPLHSWVLINTMVLHGVIDVHTPRLNLTVSVASDLHNILPAAGS